MIKDVRFLRRRLGLIIKEAESLFFLILAQRQSVRSEQLRLAPVELHEFFLQLLSGILELTLIFGMIFLQFLKFGMQLKFVQLIFLSLSL